MADRIDFQEFVGGFVVEADELLKLANASLLEIDSGLKESATRPKSVRELFRALHTIKGLAAMIGIEPIVEIAHAAEALVRGADRSGGRLRRDAVDVCLAAVREIAGLAARGVDVRQLRELAELQSRQLRDLRRAILRARLVRVAESFEPLELLVRSLNRTSGREAHLVIDAGSTELDKAVADRLLPAIIHLVRNAIDHALEPADERERAGKPAAGTVTVRCRAMGGNQLELEIADDGRGIAREAVARRARRPVDDARALLDVLPPPGFSSRR